MYKLVYIVICDCPLQNLGGGVMGCNGDEHYHIDSVWTSERKAKKRCSELNSEENKEFREDYGYGLFNIDQQILCR